jgi:hypothetical protein
MNDIGIHPRPTYHIVAIMNAGANMKQVSFKPIHNPNNDPAAKPRSFLLL